MNQQEREKLQSQLFDAQDPKEKLRILLELAWRYVQFDTEQTSHYINEANTVLSNVIPEYTRGYFDRDVVLGSMYLREGKYTEALNLLASAEAYYISQNEKHALIRCYFAIHEIYYWLGNFDLHREYTLKKLRIAQELDLSDEIAKSYMSIGIAYERQDEFDKALECFFNALTHFEELEAHKFMGSTLLNMTNVYRKLRRYDEALECAKRAYPFSEKAGQRDAMAIILGIEGLVYEDMGNYEQALECHYGKLKIVEQLDSDYMRGYTFGDIGRALVKKGDIDGGIDWLESAIEVCEKNNLRDALMQAYEAIVDAYKILNDYAHAFHYHEKWTQLNAIMLKQRIETDRNSLIVLHQTREAQLEAKMHRERAEQFRNLAEHSPDWILRVAPDGSYTYANSAVARIFATDDPRKLNLPDEIRTLFAQTSAQVFTSGQMQRTEFVYHLHDETPVYYELLGVPEFDSKNELESILLISRDITLHKRAEQEAKEVSIRNERLRISREMHDVVSQQLFSAGIIAESLGMMVDTNPLKVSAGLSDLTDLIKTASVEMRMLLHELHPDIMMQKPLDALIKGLIESFQGNHHQVEFIVDMDCQRHDTPHVIKHNVYRIVQEALNNIAKYAQAQHVWVTLRCHDSEFQLTLKDDGKGFQLDKTRAESMGLKIMRERAALAGLMLEIHSQEGKGTRIELRSS